MANMDESCDLCSSPGGSILWQSPFCRVVRVNDLHYPGFCRVIWSRHVREMSDLDAHEQAILMRVVFAVESVIRQLFNPDKMNLASFGNMVPHVHWHVIPRWREDRHFPEPVWASVRREGLVPRPVVSDTALMQAMDHALKNIE